MSTTYASFLRLDELLSLQRPEGHERDEPEHDELLFVIIHQVYELWFKQVLHELDYLAVKLQESDRPRAQHTLKRVLTIVKIMVAQLDILETMTPSEFLTFRDHLENGSGFESHQFRELEFVLGHKREEPIGRYAEGSAERQRLAARFAAPSLWDRFLRHLADAGYDIPPHILERDFTQPTPASPEVQAVLVRIYRTDPGATVLCERFTDLDEGIQEWRYRHVKMVERTIGTKRGTGGSAGAEYLKTTLFKPLFPDLWAIRTEL
jgi:tryptophan 2,3-dioxygenase